MKKEPIEPPDLPAWVDELSFSDIPHDPSEVHDLQMKALAGDTEAAWMLYIRQTVIEASTGVAKLMSMASSNRRFLEAGIYFKVVDSVYLEAGKTLPGRKRLAKDTLAMYGKILGPKAEALFTPKIARRYIDGGRSALPFSSEFYPTKR